MTRGWLLALFALALVARLPGLDRSLWYDELFTLARFTGSPLEALGEQAQANNHPLASLLAWAALHVATSEAGLRAPFLLLGAAAAPALGWSIARAFGPACGRLAGGLAALAPLHVAFAQQVRGYAGLLLAASLLAGQVPRLLAGRGTRRDEVAVAACGALGAWSHATLLVPLGGWIALALVAPRLGLATAAGRAAALRGLAGGGAGGLLLLAPVVDDLFKHARRTLGAPPGPFDPGPLGAAHLLDLLGGPEATSGAVGAGLALALVALAVVGVASRASEDRPGVASLCVPPAGALLLVALGAPGYPRLALFALPSALALAALGVRALPRARARAVVAGLLLAGAWVAGDLARAPLQDYRAAARVARAWAGPDGRVLGAGVGGALLRAYDPDAEADEGWSGVDEALARDDARVVVVVPFPAWTPPGLRARLEARGAPVLVPGRVSAVAVWAPR